MNLIPKLAQGAALLATCSLSTLPAYGHNDHLDHGDDGLRTLPGLRYAHDLSHAGVSRQPVLADFTGDMRPDLLSCLGNQPYLSVSVGSMNLETDLPMPPSSFGVAALGKVDFPALEVPAMLGSLDNTLVVWTIDPNSRTIASQIPAGGAAWASAISIHSVDLGTDGQQELIGQFPGPGNSTIIRVGEWTGNPTLPNSLTITETHSMVLAAQLSFVTTSDLFAADSGEEIVFAFGNRVAVLSESLAFLDIHFLNGDVICGTPIEDAKGAGVAVVTRDTNDLDSVVVVRPGVVEPATPIGYSQIHSMAAADSLAFGTDDLVLLGAYVEVLKNAPTPSGPTYISPSGAPTFAVDQGAVDLTWPWIVAGDLDNDGDSDIAWFSQATTMNQTPHIYVTYNSSVDEGQEGVLLDNSLLTFEDPLDFADSTIQMTLGEASAQQNCGYTHVQMVLLTTLPAGVMHAYAQLTEIAPQGNDEVIAEITYTHPTGSTEEAAQFYLRPVELDEATGRIVRAGPELRFEAGLHFVANKGSSGLPNTGAPSGYWTYSLTHIGGVPGAPPPGPRDPRGGNNGPPPTGTGG